MLHWGGLTDVGFHRETNEDHIKAEYIDDTKKLLFASVADGMGSHNQDIQPAVLILNEITMHLKNAYSVKPDLFRENKLFFLQEALFHANRIIGAVKLGNEELFAGFAASVTCCIITEDGVFSFAHAGNTRLYLLRTKNGDSNLLQLTKDATRAQILVDEGKLEPELYYSHQDRLALTSGIGVAADPFIQTFEGNLKENDVLLLTSDGIHYAIRPEGIKNVILASEGYEAAAANLITGAKEMKYNDNMSALLVANF